MATYEYRCRTTTCALYNVIIPFSSHSLSVECGRCHNVLKRKFSFQAAPVFEPHYNYAVGQHVNSMREFTDALKRGAEDNHRQTGAEHSYVPVHPADMKPPSEEGLYETAKVKHDMGIQ